MSVAIDLRHGCGASKQEHIKPGAIPVQRKAASACCGEKLAEGGTDEAGHTCTKCAKATEKVLGPAIAHWTCGCGVRRSQLVTVPVDEPVTTVTVPQAEPITLVPARKGA
jgi:hypothetical protein